jgi:hypothetical protein
MNLKNGRRKLNLLLDLLSRKCLKSLQHFTRRRIGGCDCHEQILPPNIFLQLLRRDHGAMRKLLDHDTIQYAGRYQRGFAV